MKLRNEQGNALLITLFILLVTMSVVAMVLNDTANTAHITNRARQYQAAQAAAAGAVDYAYAVWLKRTSNAHSKLSSKSDLAITGPSFSGANTPPGTPGFVYATTGSLSIVALDKYGKAITDESAPDHVIGPVPGYQGWWGHTYTYAATARLQVDGTGANLVTAGARRLFHYTEVPLFQCMFFYQHNLEIGNPAKISIKGLIHTNSNLFLSAQRGNASDKSSSNLDIKGHVSFVGSYSTPSTLSYSNYSVSNLYAPYWESGESSQLAQVSTISPMGTSLDTLFNDSAYTSNSNVNGGYHELIEPPVSGTDPAAIADRRMYNVAANTASQTEDAGGIIIQITGTNVTANNIGFTTLDPTTHLPVPVAGKTTLIAVGSGAAIQTGTAAAAAFAKALSKKMYNSGSSSISGTAHLWDDREEKYVNVTDVDMQYFQTALSTYVTNFSNVAYIYDSTAVTSSNYNALRLKNGYNISSDDGLTIASVNPVYIQGDFNTSTSSSTTPDTNKSNSTIDSNNVASGYTSKPCSVIADAITLLSNSWNDSASLKLASRNASSTTYNVAMLGGFMGTTGNIYSGGAVNYPRFLENWSGDYCTYWGSMVELFASKTGTAYWQTPGSYYYAPERRFVYDTQFSSKSPPGSVNAIVLSRGLWSHY